MVQLVLETDNLILELDDLAFAFDELRLLTLQVERLRVNQLVEVVDTCELLLNVHFERPGLCSQVR